MKQDKIRFDPQIAQVCDTPFEMPEERRIEPTVIPIRQRLTLEWIKLGLVLVVGIALRKDAHPHLVEWRLLERG